MYCDWASNGVITDCASSNAKVKRDEEYGVAFVGGSADASENTASAVDSSAETSSPVDPSSAVETPVESSAASTVANADSYIAVGSDTAATTDSSDVTTAGTEISAAGATSTSYVDIYTTETEETATASTGSQATSTDALDPPEISVVPYVYNGTSTISPISFQNITYSNVTSSDTASANTSSSPISDITSSGPTPPTNVTLSIQPLNTTHFVAVLQASTLNNTPILTDWSFSFNSDYQILGADRGNLTYKGGSYTITSIPIQEPATNMAVVVRLWGVYDSSTAEGLVGVGGVTGAGAVNGSLSMIKRAIRMGFGF